MASIIGLFTRTLIVLAFASAALADQANTAPIYSTYQGKGANLTVSKTGPEFTTIAFDGSDLQRQTLVKDFESYDFFGIDGEGLIVDEGAPALPHVTRYYRIPETGGVDLVIRAAEFDLIENINAIPYVEEGNEFRRDVKDPMIYGDNAWYPPSIVEMSEPMIMRDFRVVTVRIYPVQINPVTRQARVYGNVQVDLVPNDLPSVNELGRVRRPTKSYVPMYQHLIENLDDHALDDATTKPGTYMIFARTDGAVNQWVDSLVLWKKRSGHLVEVNQQASWTATQIMNIIRANFQNQDIEDEDRVEFVCLMGDPQASFGIPVSGSSDYDHGYALGNTGDDIEDIGVGRFCASSSSDFATMFAKTVAYERNPHMDDPTWFRKAFLYAGIARELTSNYTTFQWFQDMLIRNTGIDSVYLLTHSGDAVNDATIVQQINSGRGIFLWRGSWIGGMSNSVAGQCNNGAKLPISLTVTCATGSFESGVALSEAWALAGSAASPKGAVCGLGTATAGTHPPENLCVTGGLCYAIANQRIEHLSHCVNSAKAWLVPTFGAGSSQSNNFQRWFNLMGDPGLAIWTETPQVVAATHAGTLNVGARSLTVHLGDNQSGAPVADALVTAWKGTECYVRGLTNMNGDIVLPITVDSPGTLLLTATKHNMKPYLTNVSVAAASENIGYLTMTVDDDNAGGTSGNGDGLPNPGETVDLAVVMQNSGTSVTVTGISAALTTTNGKATVVTGNSTYPALAPGQSAMGATPFRLQLSQDLQHNEIVPLRFAITSSGTPTVSLVDMSVRAARIQYSTHAFVGAFGPGQTRDMSVTLRNRGVLPMTGVSARLISGSPFVSVETGIVSYPDIAVGGTAVNTANRFTLSANTLTFPGHQAPMTLIVTGNGGFADTVFFNAAVGSAAGTDPCGPDAYGYYAYDNVDIAYELHPDYNWVDISTGLGTNLNLNDPGEKTQISAIYAAARQLPFPFQFYGVQYDTLTITASGWVAFGNQAWIDHFRNYPIPAQSAPRAMIAPYWDDLKTNGAGQGVWYYHDQANDRVIVQWKASSGSGWSTNHNFQVILYGQTLTPTLDGNGRILIQYNTVTMNTSGAFGTEISGSSVGIHDESQLIGLQLAYRSTYSPGCATIQAGRAILITTDARALFGTVVGTVTDAETSQPMQDVRVTIDGFNYNDMTDASGQYVIENVLIGEYTVRAHKPGFNESTVSGVLVDLDSTVTVNFSMLHPEMELSAQALTIAYPQQSSASFNVINDGNGPLDYQIRMSHTINGEIVNDWSPVQYINISELTGDFQMLGCEFVNDLWFVSGGSGPTGTNWIYRFDRQGNHIEPAIPQPSTSPFGWYDLAFDGSYLYGSQDGSGTITGIDLNGNVVVQIPSPLNPTRAIAYDPALDRFWIGDFTQNIYSIDRDGNIFAQVVNDGPGELAITGLAWWPQDPDGYKLYIFSRDGGTNQTRVTRMHPTTYDRQTVAVLESSDYTAGGCTVTADYDDLMVSFGGVLQHSTGDKLGVYQMKFVQDWATITPAQATVSGGQAREVTLTANLTNFRTAVHTVSLFVSNAVLELEIELPVTLDVATAIGDDPRNELLPLEYSLSQNYPNPFNPSTTIEYSLKQTNQTRLSVYNVAGQEVARLVDGMQQAGAHSVQFDASGLPSGMYFYRLESGNFTRSAKMILLK